MRAFSHGDRAAALPPAPEGVGNLRAPARSGLREAWFGERLAHPHLVRFLEMFEVRRALWGSSEFTALQLVRAAQSWRCRAATLATGRDWDPCFFLCRHSIVQVSLQRGECRRFPETD